MVFGDYVRTHYLSILATPAEAAGALLGGIGGASIGTSLLHMASRPNSRSSRYRFEPLPERDDREQELIDLRRQLALSQQSSVVPQPDVNQKLEFLIKCQGEAKSASDVVVSVLSQIANEFGAIKDKHSRLEEVVADQQFGNQAKFSSMDQKWKPWLTRTRK